MASAAVFWDRDGTLIRDKGFLSDPAGVELIPGAASALQHAARLGYLIFLVTNQSGVGRGYFSLDDVAAVSGRMLDLMGLPPTVFAGTCVAVETPDQPSLYRKPSPRFVLEMIAKHSLDPHRCYMVGDKASDVLTAVRAGIRPVFVASGRPELEAARRAAGDDLAVFPSIREFAATLA